MPFLASPDYHGRNTLSGLTGAVFTVCLRYLRINGLYIVAAIAAKLLPETHVC